MDILKHLENLSNAINRWMAPHAQGILRRYPVTFGVLILFGVTALHEGLKGVMKELGLLDISPWYLIIAGLAIFNFCGEDIVFTAKNNLIGYSDFHDDKGNILASDSPGCSGPDVDYTVKPAVGTAPSLTEWHTKVTLPAGHYYCHIELCDPTGRVEESDFTVDKK